MSLRTPLCSRRTALATLAGVAVSSVGCIGRDETVETDDADRIDDTGDDDRTEDDDDPPADDADDTEPTEDDEPDEADDEPVHPDSWSVEHVAEGLAHPWGLEFIPEDGRLLVTERSGGLRLIDPADGTTDALDGVPDVHAERQGGLLDVTIHPAYPEEPHVYLTYSLPGENGDSATAVGRGELRLDELELRDFEPIYVVEPFVNPANHYGSRAVFGADDMLYVTSGDRTSRDSAQRRENAIGSTLRLHPDGSIPEDNPFVGDADVEPAIYSYGHRNAQGMTVHPDTGEIWQSEHGEQDGDELNVITAGGNYGWPIAHYGCEYDSDEPVGDRPDERDDVVEPVYYWECNTGGFPPAGMAFYVGDAFPDWRGDLLVGGLATQYLARFTIDESYTVEEADPLLDGEGWRIRDVTIEPETGYIYVAIDDADASVVRLVPD